MSHSHPIKETKEQSNRKSKPEVKNNEEVRKSTPKGVTKGSGE